MHNESPTGEPRSGFSVGFSRLTRSDSSRTLDSPVLVKPLAALAAIALGLGLALSAAAPASAAEARPDAPSSQHRWGQPLSSFEQYYGTSNYVPERPKRGGWINEPFYKLTRCVPTTKNPCTPMMVQLGEPFVQVNGTNNYLQVPIFVFGEKDNRAGALSQPFGIQGAPGDGLPQPEIICGSGEWTDGAMLNTRRQVSNNLGTTGVGAATGEWTWFSNYLVSNIIMPSNCSHIVMIVLNISYGAKLHQVVWLAEDNYGKGPDADGNYQSVPYNGADKDWGKELCRVGGVSVSPECVFHLADRIDPVDFDTVCANPPQMEWLNWNWLPATVGFYARCLFQPAAGWDRESWVSNAWTGGTGGKITGMATAAGNAFKIGENCGVLLQSGSSSKLANFTVNTCAWSTWAAPLKVVLGIWATVAFGMWAIGFLISCIAGVVNRKVPNPTEEAASS